MLLTQLPTYLDGKNKDFISHDQLSMGSNVSTLMSRHIRLGYKENGNDSSYSIFGNGRRSSIWRLLSGRAENQIQHLYYDSMSIKSIK